MPLFAPKKYKGVQDLKETELDCGLVYNLENVYGDVEIGKDLFNDLEVFHPYDNESQDSTLYSIVNNDHTHTKGGALFLKRILESPQYDINVLKGRTQCLKQLGSSSSPQLVDNAETLRHMDKMEQDFLWMCSQKDESVSNILDGIYFNQFFNRKCNEYPRVLTSYNLYNIIVSPTIGILSPVMFFIMPYMILMYTFGKSFNISFTTYMRTLWNSFFNAPPLYSLLGPKGKWLSRINTVSYILSMCFYFQGILNSVQLSKTTTQIVKYISNKTNNAMVFLQTAHTATSKHAELLKQYAPFYCAPGSLIHENPEADALLKGYKPYKEFSIFSHFGVQLKLYKSFDKEMFKPLVNRLYFLDSLMAITSLKSKSNLALPTYQQYQHQDSCRPVYDSHKAWNIHLNKQTAVCNDFQATNTIITGPNAGGKSTFVKMVVTNALLAQTLCVASCESLDMTPFKVINTQINIPDCKGHESLFEAEMNRCLDNLNTMLKHQSYPCLVALDEIFSSTNVVEAISGAYAILENMATQTNTLTIVTTHLSYLTNLKKTTNFQCKRMSVDISGDGDSTCISYPYVLMDGVSKQYIALELLRNKGFDKSIVQRAIEVKNKFTKKTKMTNSASLKIDN